jgi:very-short-patch-repair endonuclease
VPPVPLDPRSDAFAYQMLDRHQRRREEQGIPTLTMLVGPPGRAVGLLRQWLSARHRPLCTAAVDTEAEAVRAWGELLARTRDLRADAAEFLGSFAGFSPGELRARLERKTVHEREVLLQELFPLVPNGDAAAICRELLSGSAPQASSLSFGAVLASCGGEASRVFAALHALVPAGSAPALLLTGSGPESLTRAARTAARLCAAVPAVPLALNMERRFVDSFLAGTGGQPQALVREGRVELEAPSPEELWRRLEVLGVRQPQELSSSLSRLAEDGASEELLTRFAEAARDREAAATGDAVEADRARSAAERFLQLLLEELPETQGLFELNERTEFLINNRPVEVDFLSRRLRVAIEIDGYYHFRDMEAYRRDRRKDLALQCHGYLVLRFLAEDVVARFREIRDTLQEVVTQRRDLVRRPSPPGEDADGGA